MSLGRISDVLASQQLLKDNPKTYKRLVVQSIPTYRFQPEKVRMLQWVSPPVRAAIRACTDGVSPWPLFVFGPVGTGKSCAGLCLCDRVKHSLYWTEETLVQDATDAMMDRLVNRAGQDVSLRGFWKGVRDAPLVIVDEIGVRNTVSDHRYSVIKGVLDAREGQPLMIVSNLDPEEIAKAFDERIASRALCGTYVKASGEDRRMKR